jgi:phage shock protein A
MKATLSCLVVLFVLAPALKAQQPCGGAFVFWNSSEEKMRDSSLNGTYYFPAEAATFSNAFQGLANWAIAFDVETQSNIARMCQVFQRQDEQLEALKAEVAALRKQVAAISAKSAKAGK